MFQEEEDELGMARTYHNLGMTYADKGVWKTAMDCYERGFGMAQKLGALDVMANIYLSRAELLQELGDSSLAASCCARALDIYRKTGNRLGEADTYRVLGRVFMAQSQWTTAAGLFKDSLRLNVEYSKPLNVAETHRDLGKMQAAMGHTAEARASFEAALAGFRKLGAKADVAEAEGLIGGLGRERL
jgi:tetratricopeptide (TPR) repeat protein